MAIAPKVITVDFETEGIEPRPRYPPVPVSVGIKWPDDPTYKIMGWGHPTGNNCTKKEAYGELRRAYGSKYPLLFQNSSFDLDVCEVHFDLKLPSWEKTHDTIYLLFLQDPHSPSLALKNCAERYLGIKPEERDLMNDWIVANVPEARQRPSTAGAYICRCPFKIVAPYLKGDLTRTLKLFNYLYPRVERAGMLPAYQRELKLMPILLRNARQGMRLDMDRLEQDLPVMKSGIEKADVWLRKLLGIENIDSDRQLGQALYDKGIVTDVKQTSKGHISVSKKNLILERFKDKRVYHALQYRNQMSTSVNMFMEPWLELGGADHGIMHPNWIQVRSSKGGGDNLNGARSGRIICTRPNWLNIPKRWKRAASAGYVHPTFLRVPELPFMRQYCLPDKGELWGKRDFSGQELRLFAHAEEGPVMRGFLASPLTRPCLKCGAPIGKKCVGGTLHKEREYDIHEEVRAEAERQLIAAGLRDSFDRDTAKSCVFGRIYGQGLAGLMQLLQLEEHERPIAQVIQRAINTAVPSIKELDDQMQALTKNGLPIMTWGGRLYYAEPDQYSEKYGRNMSFHYKDLNYYCQSSGADCTKETLIRFDEHPKRKGRFLNTVYDEISFSTIAKLMANDQKVLLECMLSLEVDVPMLSEGESGKTWGGLEKFKDR
jgi:DNA polymerase I-like protein with 3'-5' exonuclease and polymerase domains